MERLRAVTIILLMVVALPTLASSSSSPPRSASALLQEGLYAEEVDGNLDAAIEIYEQVIKDPAAQRSDVAQALYRQGMCYMKKQQDQQAKLVFEKLVTDYSDQTKVISKAKPLLQGLSNADPAALMPPDTLVYVELGSPGKQVETILKMLEGTPIENALAAIGGANEGGPSPVQIVASFLIPNMMAEFKKIRAVGLGITGVAQGAAYDDTVVILASPSAYKAGQLTWSVKQYKGVGGGATLASSNPSFAKISKKARQENALTIWANVDRAYAAMTKLFPEGQIPENIRHANELADFAHISDLIASVSLEPRDVALEVNVALKEGYNGLAYNLFRTPKLSRAAFDAVPSNAFVLASVALGGANSPQSQKLREQIRNAKGIEMGGDIFANVEQVTLFVLPSDGTAAASVPGLPPFVGSLGLVLTSSNPQQTRQILTGLLTAFKLLATEPGSEQGGRYQLQLTNNQTIQCYVDQKNKATVLSLSPSVIDASASALARGQSVTSTGPLDNVLSTLSPTVNKLALVNVGGAIRAGGALVGAAHGEAAGKTSELMAQLAESCDKTTVLLRTHEASGDFNVRAEIRDLPPLKDVFGPLTELSDMISAAKEKAWAEKRQAETPACVTKTSRPVAIDGKVENLWSEARRYELGNVIYSPVSSKEDCSAFYKAMWDADNLYLLVNVTDDSLKNDSDSDLWYQDDCVEVFIDADNAKSQNYGNNDGQYHFDWDRTNPSMDRFEHGRLDGVEFAMVTTGNGYLTEIKFPWSTLGIKPSAGTKIGLDVHVDDDDDGGDRDTKLTWRGKEDNAWQTPSAFGTAELTGLIGWWKLDETSGRDVADASGNGNIGKILNGTPKWQAANGKIGGALLFDGKGDWVQVANESKFDCVAEVTVAAWIKVNRFDKEWQAIVTKGDSAWRLQRNQDTDNLEFACTGLDVPSKSPYGGLYGQRNVNDGKWHHVAGVYDGQKMTLYVDGAVDVSQPASGPISTNDQPVYIGENAEITGRFWNGLIDDVRVYDCTLGQSEIEALYNEGK
ncbi:MAG: sugar-binding protein [Sedimentisphaerales bacterium]